MKQRLLSKADAELLIGRGEIVDRPDLAALDEALGRVRDSAQDVSVTPTPRLAAVLATGVAPTPTAPRQQRLARRMGAVLSATLGLKVALGSMAAAAALVGAGAAGVLPQPLQDVVDRIISPSAPPPEREMVPAPDEGPTERTGTTKDTSLRGQAGSGGERFGDRDRSGGDKDSRDGSPSGVAPAPTGTGEPSSPATDLGGGGKDPDAPSGGRDGKEDRDDSDEEDDDPDHGDRDLEDVDEDDEDVPDADDDPPDLEDQEALLDPEDDDGE